MGDNETQALADIEMSLNFKLPIIVLEGSPLCKVILQDLN